MHEIPLQRVAAIHDLSGFGRASLTVVIPILAGMGVQTCPLPTAVLSSQTSGVEGFTFPPRWAPCWITGSSWA